MGLHPSFSIGLGEGEIAGGAVDVSGIVKDRAVILRKFDFKESSIIAVALTRTHGKVRFLAKGARKTKSAFSGGLRTGNLLEVVFYFKEHGGLQLLREVSDCGTGDPDASDFERLCIFQAGLELIDRVTVERESDVRFFTVLEEFVLDLPAFDDPWTGFFTLEVRLLGCLGLYPELGECSGCGASTAGVSFTVDPASGDVICGKCAGGRRIELTPETSAILGRMEREGYGDMVHERLDRPVRRKIGRFLHGLFLHHIDGYRLPSALRLLKEGGTL